MVCRVLLASFFCFLFSPLTTLAVSSDNTLTLGIFPRRNVDTTIRYFKPIARYLSDRIGRPVEVLTARDYESFWQQVEAGRFQLFHYNQYDYARGSHELGHRVILKNEEYGSQDIAGAILVRKDSDVETLSDLKGKKIVFGGGPTAMMSTIVPMHLLQANGIGENDYTRIFSKNPPSAVFATYYGHADAGGAGDVATRIPTVSERIDVSKLKVLAVSDPLTHLPWAVSPKVAPELAERIQTVLSDLGHSDEGRALLAGAELTNLTPAQDRDYDLHRRIIYEVLGEDYCNPACALSVDGGKIERGGGTFVLGVLPRRPQKLTRSMFEPFAANLGTALGRKVELVVGKDFEEFWKGVTEKRYDLVHYNQYHYVKSHTLYGYRAIGRNEEQGQSLVSPVIWVRKDSGIDDLSGIRGRKVIFGGGKMAMMAYIGPTYLLREAGLGESDYEALYAINPVAGCRAAYLGQADACGAGDIMFRLPVLKEQVDVSEMKIIATGEPLAFLVWAVGETLPERLVDRIQMHLTGLAKHERGREILDSVRMSAILPSADNDFDRHRTMIEMVLGESY